MTCTLGRPYNNMHAAVDKVARGGERTANAQLVATSLQDPFEADFGDLAAGWGESRNERRLDRQSDDLEPSCRETQLDRDGPLIHQPGTDLKRPRATDMHRIACRNLFCLV